MKYLSENRLKNFEKERVLVRSISVYNEVVYVLTDKGKKWCNQNVFETDKLFYSGTSKIHDCAIFKQISQLPIQYLDSIKSEPELRREYNNRLHYLQTHNHEDYLYHSERKYSVPDFAYCTHENNTCVEIVTSSYRQEQILEREAFASFMGYTIDFHKI